MSSVLKIQHEIIGSARDFLAKEGFFEILPVLLSAETDPLCHEVVDAKIPYCGMEFFLMKSMILHKQIALKHLDKIFCFSPNIRLETEEKRDSGRHLLEFTQLDLEVKGAKRDEILSLGEKLFSYVMLSVLKKHRADLSRLTMPLVPFRRITYADAVEKYGLDFELKLSTEAKSPVWLIDIPIEKREFYDREDPARPGILLDYDLIYPEGFGEALSGGEREFEYGKVVERIKKAGGSPEKFAKYLEVVKEGIPPSAGFGIGIERLTRYICDLEHVKDARLFAKVPGGGLTL
ncbi:MAG: asparagine synthetase A [archaeon]